jgi:hypothetical protein
MRRFTVRFVRADSWSDLENALRYSPLNRGADELVHLSLRRGPNPPRFIKAVKSIIYSNINPELEQLLSLEGPVRHTGALLDPEAKEFIPSVQTQELVDNIDDQEEGNQAADQSDADAFTGLIPSQVDYLASMPKTQSERTLTTEEINLSKRILFFYRRYAFRQRVKMRRAVRTIWAYYSRYRLRHKAPRTTNGDRIRKLHNEYKQDVESINCPLLYAKAFHRHERILLGYMPHVALYLRGLEQANQQQKDANKKRLQKVQHEELEKVQLKMNICR